MLSMSKRLLPLLITLSVVLCEEHVDSNWEDYDGDEICGVYGGRSALVGNTIYFIGSKLVAYGRDGETHDSLFSISLDKVHHANVSLDKSNLRKGTSPPGLGDSKDGGFWYTDTSLFAVAGSEHDENPRPTSLWSYKVEKEAWEEAPVTVSNGSEDFLLGERKNAMYSSVPRFGLSFLSGGADGEYFPVRFDASQPDRLQWRTEKPPHLDENSSPGPQRGGGYSFWVPVGVKGLLIYVGGLDKTRRGEDDGKEFEPGPAPLSQVDVYDIETGRWFDIKTNRSPPSPRREFCGWVSSASDNSSYSITIYGGQSIDGNSADGGIYVLSVPSFQWVEIRNDPVKIRDHSCLQHRDSKGFVLGGRSGKEKEKEKEKCDVSPFRLLNLSTYTWESNFDINEQIPYRIHESIYKIIGGDALGNATPINPEHNLPPELAEIFASSIPEPNSPTQDPGNPETTSPGDSLQSDSGAPDDGIPDAPSSPSTRNAIIGGVVGGSVFVIIGLVLVFLLARRRRKNWLKPSLKSSKHSSSTTINDDGNSVTPAPAMGYGRAYQDPSPVHPPERPEFQEQPWNTQFAGHQEPHPAPSAYREAHVQPPQADTRSATNTARDTQDSRAMSAVSSAMGTILICDGDSNEYSPVRMDVSPVGSQRSRTGRGSRNAVQFGDQGNQGMRFI